MKNRHFTVILTTILVIFNAVIWIALGIIGLNTRSALSVPPQTNAILAILSFAMAGILLGLFVLMHRGNRNAYYLTVAFFIFVSLVTIFNDVGLADIVVLVLNLIPIALLIKDRKHYLISPPKPISSE
jgi:hypothetical protein